MDRKQDYGSNNHHGWRSQLNNIYRKSISLHNHTNHVGAVLNKEKSKLVFPPLPRELKLLEIDYNEFIDLFNNQSRRNDDKFKKSIASPTVDDMVASLDFFEGLLISHVNESVDIRNSTININGYISSLPFPLDSKSVAQVKNGVIKELNSIIESSVNTLSSISDLETDKVRSSFSNSQTSHDLKYRLSFLIESIKKLKNHINDTIEVSNKLYSHCISLFDETADDEKDVEYSLENVKVDWTTCKQAYDNVNFSNRSVNYSVFMQAKSLPVCYELYMYLQSPRDFGFVLRITDYSFHINELMSIFEYLLLQHNLSFEQNSSSVMNITQQLFFYNCNLNDKDISVISCYLHLFPSLILLNMSRNMITSKGIHFILDALCSCSSSIRSLNFDHNDIDSDGGDSIAQSLQYLPSLHILSLSHNHSFRDQGDVLFLLFVYNSFYLFMLIYIFFI